MMPLFLRPQTAARGEGRSGIPETWTSLTATRTVPSGSTAHELIGAPIVRRREIHRIRPEIRFVRHGTSSRFPWFILLAVFTLVGSTSAETWRGFTVERREAAALERIPNRRYVGLTSRRHMHEFDVAAFCVTS